MGCSQSTPKSPPPSPVAPSSDPPFPSGGGGSKHGSAAAPGSFHGSDKMEPPVGDVAQGAPLGGVPPPPPGLPPSLATPQFQSAIQEVTNASAPLQYQLPPQQQKLPQTTAAGQGSAETDITVNGTSNALHPVSVGSAPDAVALSNASNADAQWKDLWEALSPNLLDPADVTAVTNEVMNKTTNQMLATEVNFILRRIRQVVRRLPRPTNNSIANTAGKSLRVFTSNANNQNSLDAEGKLTAERHHLLSNHVFRRILGGPLDIPKPDTKEAAAVFPDPMEAAFILLLHLSSEALGERAATIAARTAEKAGLEMDVNKGRNFSQRPSPPGIPKDEMPDLPPGITSQSLAYLVALALRK